MQPLADRRRDRAADAAIDLVEHQGRHRRGARQHHLERQHEARQLAARGDLGERSRRRAGIGRHLEVHALGAVLAPIRLVERFEDRGEARLVELERRQLLRHRRVERLAPRGGGAGHAFSGGRDIVRRAPRPRGASSVFTRSPPSSSVAIVAAISARSCGSASTATPCLRAERAQREKPLLDLLEPRRAAAQRARLGLERGDRLARLERGALEAAPAASSRPMALSRKRSSARWALAERAFGAALARRARAARPRAPRSSRSRFCRSARSSARLCSSPALGSSASSSASAWRR